MPPVPDTIVPGNHYVVVEALFSAPAPRRGEINWRAFVEPRANAVLYLQAGSADCTGQVYLQDPPTAGSTATPSSPAATLECDGAIAVGVRPGSLAAEPKSPPDWSATVTVGATLAHVYTECARIWNPIHTDRAVARAVGLPDIILHGTATLALAVSTILEREGIDAGANLSSIACRFSGMVPLPSAIQVVAWRVRGADDGRVIAFQALTVGGRAALQGGRLVVNPPDISHERSR